MFQFHSSFLHYCHHPNPCHHHHSPRPVKMPHTLDPFLILTNLFVTVIVTAHYNSMTFCKCPFLNLGHSPGQIGLHFRSVLKIQSRVKVISKSLHDASPACTFCLTSSISPYNSVPQSHQNLSSPFKTLCCLLFLYLYTSYSLCLTPSPLQLYQSSLIYLSGIISKVISSEKLALIFHKNIEPVSRSVCVIVFPEKLQVM